MAELISAYKPSCCNKAYMSKSSAVRHEKNCPKNPENRACQTCKHRIETTETYYNPYHNGDCGSSDSDYKCWWCEVHEMKIDSFSANVDGIGMQPKMHCEHWERTPTADVVEVETIKAWLYEMAINNVGCVIDGDFSNACEEIIARLDGLRNFAKERSENNG